MLLLYYAFSWGGLGIHRFYLGYTLIGIIQLLTLGMFGIWSLIDFILILTGALKDAQGNELS
ncbi:MAG: TM2 domain-containing protein [Synechococcaceae cyanobacterium RL_1_2]|nr:TM2 domain-containing protein [Synechococcaceae cyanobacterium RL_1_2]